MRRWLGAAVLAVVCALAGCSDGAEPQITADPDPPATTVGDDPRIAKLKSNDPSAQRAYAYAANFALRYQFSSDYLRLPADQMVEGDFDQFEDVLTPSALDTLRDAVETASADPAALDTVRALTFVDLSASLDGTDLSLRDGTSVVAEQRITQPRYERDSGTPVVWLVSSGRVLVNDTKGPTNVPYAVRLRIDLDEDGDGGLLVQAWKATWAFRGEKPAPLE